MTERFSLSISAVFPDIPLLDRAGRATKLGYSTLEAWWPWPEADPDQAKVDEFVASFVEAGARLHLLNLCEGGIAFGGRGLAGVPEAADDFWSNAERAIELARTLGARYLNVLAGNVGPLGRETGLAVLERRLRGLAPLARSAGIGLVVEQLNAHDHPDYLMTRPEDVLALTRRVRSQGNPEVGMLADIYHLARTDIDPVAFMAENAAEICHVQLADFPGRGRPGTGELDIARIVYSLESNGYTGLLGLEYVDAAGGAAKLGPPEILWRQITATHSGGLPS